jgi:PAS domain-containing protein
MSDMNLLEIDFKKAKVRHLLFKARLRSILYGSDTDEGPVISHLECSLGQWIYSHALKAYGHIPEMHDFERIHKEIHKTAAGLIALYKNGKADEARAGLEEIEVISEHLSDTLSAVEDAAGTESYSPAETDFSEAMQLNYDELLQLNSILLDLDKRIKIQTEQSLLAKKLSEESESKFLSTLKQAPVGITILRGENLIVEMANSSYLEIVDREEANFVGKPLLESMPEVKETVGSILLEVLRTGVPYNGNEFEAIIKRFGRAEVCYFNFVYQPLAEDDARISGIVVVATEVTKQVEAKYALQRSENQFRNLVTQSQFAKAIFKGEDFVISIANESMLKTLWRRDLHEVQGRKLLDVFPELAGQKFPAILREVYKTGKTYRENEAVAYVDGPGGVMKFYLDFQYAAMFEIDGSVSGILVSMNDVSEKVEARLQISDAADRLSLATEGTQLATWDLNLQTRDIIYSSRLAEIFGYNSTRKLLHTEMRKSIHPDEPASTITKPAWYGPTKPYAG